MSHLSVGQSSYQYFPVAEEAARLPATVAILLENLLRHQGDPAQIAALRAWTPEAVKAEIEFRPARVLLQDFTGVPCVVDLATMRQVVARLGGDPARVDPIVPVDLVIDHSVIADDFGTPAAFRRNQDLEYQRNAERYRFLKWGQQGFSGLRVVPPDTGIVHQVHLEYLAQVVGQAGALAYPDSCVGTDSHTTMVNGLGVLAWGVGGIEAEAAMLGQPIPLALPTVVGVRLIGRLRPGVTATDLVLTMAERLRRHGVVGGFVEFFGQSVGRLPVETRATIANMSPEYGSTACLFPIDDQTLSYLRLTGRPPGTVDLVEAYAKAQGLWFDPNRQVAYSSVVDFDLGEVEPAVAGPKRPQDRIGLSQVPAGLRSAIAAAADPARSGVTGPIADGAVAIAAITSCTNTSNPAVMVAAGLLARKAVAAGLTVKPWVKTTLSPGSQIVTDYLAAAGLGADLERLGFYLVGYGCLTCIGNSGPVQPDMKQAVDAGVVATAVLSGNRNFEGRISPDVALNYLASPPLVVAYALAGTMDIDLTSQALGVGPAGPVYLRDIWPTQDEIAQVVAAVVDPELFQRRYAGVYDGSPAWTELAGTGGQTYLWEPSTYIRPAPYFDHLEPTPPGLADIVDARVLLWLGDSVTTDHISPAGSIAEASPAGQWLTSQGVAPADFNSYGSRRGNHEVMVRGTFANPRLRNRLLPDVAGGYTLDFTRDDQPVVTVFEAAERSRAAGVPLVILAGQEYGSGSSRDWAAKGPALLGVRAVIAGSFERIHRSNLIGMGVVPLELTDGQTIAGLGLTGQERYTIGGLSAQPLPDRLTVVAESGQRRVEFTVRPRVDTVAEAAYLRHGGILPYVVRQFLA